MVVYVYRFKQNEELQGETYCGGHGEASGKKGKCVFVVANAVLFAEN